MYMYKYLYIICTFGAKKNEIKKKRVEYAIFIKDTIKIMLDSSEQGVYKWNLLDFHHICFPDKRNVFWFCFLNCSFVMECTRKNTMLRDVVYFYLPHIHSPQSLFSSHQSLSRKQLSHILTCFSIYNVFFMWLLYGFGYSGCCCGSFKFKMTL